MIRCPKCGNSDGITMKVVSRRRVRDEERAPDTCLVIEDTYGIFCPACEHTDTNVRATDKESSWWVDDGKSTLRNKFHDIGYRREYRRILDGLAFTVEEKRDGTCLIVNTDGCFTRNQQASKDFVGAFKRCEAYSNLMSALSDNPTLTFCVELLKKGKSPTRIEIHDKDEYALFDIWDNEIQKWYDRTMNETICGRYGIPIVKIYDTIVFDENTYETYVKEFLERAKAEGREGIVLKNADEKIYMKEKNELPKVEKKPKKEDPRPILPESEIFGSISKVEAELGQDFFEVKKAMPMIAKYVSAECKKHGCRTKDNLFSYYQSYLKKDDKMVHYKCGHNSMCIIIDDNLLSTTAYLEWAETVGVDGDRSQCWVCWNKEEDEVK